MGVIRSLSRRGAALALSLGIVLGAVGAPTPMRAATTADPAEAAAGWIATKVEAGGLGASSLADAILAFAAVRVGGGAAADALTQLASKLDAYAGYGATLKPGNLGKAMLAVIVAGGDPASFHGHDLESDLRGLEISTGTDAGRFGSAENIDQALAILALAATARGVPPGAGDWLAGRQCPSGEYAWDGSCPGAPGSEDPDTTALVLQALLASGSSAAAGRAASWLLDLQARDGSFAGYGTPNVNSTGLAGQALRAAGRTAEADAAAAWIVRQQYGCAAPAASRGAFPWSASYAGELMFSTPQAVLAMGAPRMDRLSVGGAAVDARLLRCPAPAPSGPAEPTVPPTDVRGGTSPSGPSGGGVLLVVGVLAALGGVLANRGRRGRVR